MSNPSARKLSPQELETEMNSAFALGDFQRILELLDQAPNWVIKQPEFLLMRGTALLAVGHSQEGYRIFRDLEKKFPRFLPIYTPMTSMYMDFELPAHALQSARHALLEPDLPEETSSYLNEVIQNTTEIIQDIASESDLPFDTMLRAVLAEENGVLAFQDGDFSQADFYAREAIKIAPKWSDPYINRAYALFHSGRVQEAIRLGEEVLARDPENWHAMHHLVIFYTGSGQEEKAREVASRLELLARQKPEDNPEIDYAIWSLALVEDTAALWGIAERYLGHDPDSLFSRSWLCLAVAAMRSGRRAEAVMLIHKVDDEDMPSQGLRLKKLLEPEDVPDLEDLDWSPPIYPIVDQLLTPKVVAEWSHLSDSFSDTITPAQKRKMEQFFQKYPTLLAGFKRLLWEKETHLPALESLLLAGLPDTDAEIVRFALSQTGSLAERANALTGLTMTGRYNGPKTVKLWNEATKEWREVVLSLQKIGEVPARAQPRTLALIERSVRAEDPEEKIALMRKAVEGEPDSPMAVFNLGVTLIQAGYEEEGEALAYRSIEIDPNYIFGHAAIALAKAHGRDREEALKHLALVDQAEVITPETAIYASMAWAVLALAEGDLTTARQRLSIANQFDPDHPMLISLQEQLLGREFFTHTAGDIEEYQRKSATRTHRRLLQTPFAVDASLRACLMMVTKDMLVGTAHFTGAPTSGRKEQIVAGLVKTLLDADFLADWVGSDLEEDERGALHWLLETNGVRPWSEFTAKFGDDLEESVYWDYHEPETVTGRLRWAGLLFAGTLDGQQVAFLPADLRLLLKKLL